MKCCPKSIKTTLNRFFSYAMLSGAASTTLHRVWPVERCPKSIKITWNRIFLNAMLSGAPRAILHKVFTCAMLSQEHYENVEQGFFRYNVI